ncbi:LPS-assembly protein LptD [Halovulum sp. GXIMD14793]
MRFLLGLLLLFLPVTAVAQDIAGLLADRVEVTDDGNLITASGSVQVTYQGQTLSAVSLTYDRSANTIRATGPLKLTTTDGIVLLASAADLSADFRDGIIRGARLVLDRKLQIAAVEGRRIAGRYNTLYKSLASSCHVCADNPTPVWRIRARRVIHDQEKRRIYFQDAYFDVFGVPVAYLPALRIPEPGVTRATGFLAPEFLTSDIFGYGLKLPYYVTLGDHADITLAPFITSAEGFLLDAEYRQRFRRAGLTVSGALKLNETLDGGPRGFLDARGEVELGPNFRGTFRLNVASDKAFLQEFNYSDTDRLVSYARLDRVSPNDYLDFRVEGYQTLREDELQDEVPFLLPGAEYRRVVPARGIGGRIGLTVNLANLERIQGGDLLRFGGNVDWRREHVTRGGLMIETLADLKFDAYRTRNDMLFDDAFETRLVPTAAVQLRWPLSKRTRRATHIVEPIAQLVWSDRLQSGLTPNEDSLLPELDETNLFELNRFPGRDADEIGFRANIGVNYQMIRDGGWSFGATLGQVLRFEENPDFPTYSGLSTAASDIVAAAYLETPGGYRALARALFSPADLVFRRGELEFRYDSPRFGIDTSYVYLAPDPFTLTPDPLPQRQEFDIGARYRVAPNWELSANWRYDLAETQTTALKGGITYGNECVRVRLTAERRLTSANNVPTSTNFGLTVNLAGLGSKADDNWPSRRCGSGLR